MVGEASLAASAEWAALHPRVAGLFADAMVGGDFMNCSSWRPSWRHIQHSVLESVSGYVFAALKLYTCEISHETTVHHVSRMVYLTFKKVFFSVWFFFTRNIQRDVTICFSWYIFFFNTLITKRAKRAPYISGSRLGVTDIVNNFFHNISNQSQRGIGCYYSFIVKWKMVNSCMGVQRWTINNAAKLWREVLLME